MARNSFLKTVSGLLNLTALGIFLIGVSNAQLKAGTGGGDPVDDILGCRPNPGICDGSVCFIGKKCIAGQAPMQLPMTDKPTCCIPR